MTLEELIVRVQELEDRIEELEDKLVYPNPINPKMIKEE